jgi:hypothetical protein
VPVHGRTPAHDFLCFVFSCAQGFVFHFVFRVCCRIPVPLIFRSQETALGLLYLFSSPGAARLRYLGIFYRSSFTSFDFSYYQRVRDASDVLSTRVVVPLPNRLSGAGLRNSVLQLACSSSSRLVLGSEARVGDFLFSIHIFICCRCHPLSRSCS